MQKGTRKLLEVRNVCTLKAKSLDEDEEVAERETTTVKDTCQLNVMRRRLDNKRESLRRRELVVVTANPWMSFTDKLRVLAMIDWNREGENKNVVCNI